MSDSDIAISSVGIPIVSPVSKKPPYLILLKSIDEKSKVLEKFISTDKPEILQGFVQVKGFFSMESEDEITKNFGGLLTSAKKELYIEVMFPWHRVGSIRSLVFKAK
jgi:hypothetical protein